ncbi:hypothetical protein OF83DRAFT_1115254 [Amylostereum chailletii]|nr:hypothetical protein OF83DRAFT_1115254 [Amylostereum chailletii]
MAELEDILLKHPEVMDVAVIGVEDAGRGTEVPLAYIVLAEGCTQPDVLKSKEALLSSYLAERLAYFKHLRGGVIFVDAIPKSPSGKILRRQLREGIRNVRATHTGAKGG